MKTYYKVICSLSLGLLLLACQSPPEQLVAKAPQAEHDLWVQQTSSKPVENVLATTAETKQLQPTSQPDYDLWQRIRDGLTMQHMDNPRIQAELAWYRKHPAYMRRVAKRAEPYLFHIVEQIEDKQLPMELALLPIVESAYDPFAYSQGRAAGIWQFIPNTGRAMGLKQNWWYDGRRDIRASTEAALTYLQQLRTALDGDWLLGLAAYNSGQRRVERAIEYNHKRGKKLDFWSLRLPRETRSYVPKLIAVTKIMANPKAYDIELPALANKAYFGSVDTGGQIDLAQAAELADIEIEAIYLLNPAYNRWATSPEDQHPLLLPIAKVEKFKQALATLDENERVQWQRYTIKSGDSLIRIAQKFITKARIIREVNGLTNNTIRAGSTLLIPTASAPLEAYSLSADQRLAKKQNRKRGDRTDYMVRPGDSFWSIARTYQVTTTQLTSCNGLSSRDTIHPGQKLVIWQKKATVNLASTSLPKREAMVRKLGYRVRSGDSLARIANKFNVSVESILKWNTLDSSKYIQPGQLLTLYVDVTGGR